jgi:site-specific DNA recombinase
MNKHTFRNSLDKQSDTTKRVATYHRVSTGRQFANEASIPSQRKITSSFCEQNNFWIAEEFVEAKTATDDRRPVLQDMIDRACASDHPYDAIVFYAFNRFFRNVAEMELTIRKLRKHGVEVVSVTQPTGDDPSQILVRQIIGAFDEHTSREISKNTTRAMRESAKQGFGTVPRHPWDTKSSRPSGAVRRLRRSST